MRRVRRPVLHQTSQLRAESLLVCPSEGRAQKTKGSAPWRPECRLWDSRFSQFSSCFGSIPPVQLAAKRPVARRRSRRQRAMSAVPESGAAGLRQARRRLADGAVPVQRVKSRRLPGRTAREVEVESLRRSAGPASYPVKRLGRRRTSKAGFCGDGGRSGNPGPACPGRIGRAVPLSDRPNE